MDSRLGKGCQTCSWTAEPGKCFSLFPVRAWEQNIVSRIGSAVSSCVRPLILHTRAQLDALLTMEFLPLSATASSHHYTVNRNRVSPASSIRSRKCVPMAFTAESLPAFRHGVLSSLHRQPQSSQSREFYQVAQMRTDGVHCGESAGTGPVVLKIDPKTTAAAFAGITTNQFIICASLSRRTLHYIQYIVKY